MSYKGMRAIYEEMVAQSLVPSYCSGVIGMEGKLVAIVDDDQSVRAALFGLMKAVGLEARTFASAEEFLASDEQRRTGCLIADVCMPGMSGLELQAQLNAADCRIPTIFITAHADEKTRMRALQAGAVEFVPKPFNNRALVASIRAALES